jgi:outer membrane receptor protein involved in Fe transport
MQRFIAALLVHLRQGAKPGLLAVLASGWLMCAPLAHAQSNGTIAGYRVRSASTTIWNGEVGYGMTPRTRLTLEVFNLFDSKVSDIDYFYTSRLPGEPLGGVDDIHLHPSLPRAARVTLQVLF